MGVHAKHPLYPLTHILSFIFIFVFLEAGSHVDQANFEFLVLLPLTSQVMGLKAGGPMSGILCAIFKLGYLFL